MSNIKYSAVVSNQGDSEILNIKLGRSTLHEFSPDLLMMDTEKLLKVLTELFLSETSGCASLRIGGKEKQ